MRIETSSRKAALFMAVLVACPLNLLPWLAAADTASLMAPALAADSKQRSATGLDAKTLKLVNQGDWSQAATRLETLSAGLASPAKEQAWLAFAYLFLGRCTELSTLAKKVGALKPDPTETSAGPVVEAFDLTCQGKLDNAQKRLESLLPGAEKDPLVNFALAAVFGKKGQAQSAVAYSQKTVDLVPDFGWGYRTLGYLQDRWLKDPVKAEANYARALAIEPNLSEVRGQMVDIRLVKNDFDGAIDLALAGIKAGPREAGNYYRLAQIYVQQWRLREALKQLEKAISLAPKEARFHRTKASILRYQGQLNEAIAEQQAAVDLSKDKAFELVELSSLNVMAGNQNRAADNLREALKLDPNNGAAHDKLVQLLTQEKRYDDLVEEYKRALEKKPEDSGLRLGLAKVLRTAGKPDEAIQALKQAANLNQTDPQPHRELGAIYIEQKNYEAAAKEYTRALNINPTSVEDLVSLGFCYAEDGDYLQAEAALVTALALQQLTAQPGPQAQSSRLDVMRSLAVLLLEEGRYSDAASQLEAICASSKQTNNAPLDQFLLQQSKALRDRTTTGAREMISASDKLPEDVRKQQAYALVDTLLKINKPDLALEFVEKFAPAQAKSDSQWLAVTARAWLTKADLSKAHDLASQAVAVRDDEPAKASEAQLQLAEVLLAKGNLADAENAIRKAIELNPKSYAGYELSGQAYLKKGELEQAVEAGKKSLELNPYYTQAYLLVGDAQLAAGKLKDAADSFKKAAELYPGLLEAHKLLRDTYKKLALKDEAQKEDESIAQMEKRD